MLLLSELINLSPNPLLSFLSPSFLPQFFLSILYFLLKCISLDFIWCRAELFSPDDFPFFFFLLLRLLLPLLCGRGRASDAPGRHVGMPTRVYDRGHMHISY